MEDQRPEEKWIELKEALDRCSMCIHEAVCTQMETHAKYCQKAKYRFRCPIEVLDERPEE